MEQALSGIEAVARRGNVSGSAGWNERLLLLVSCGTDRKDCITIFASGKENSLVAGDAGNQACHALLATTDW